MTRWISYTFVRITLLFTTGILVGIYWPVLISFSLISYALGIITIVYFILFFINRKKRRFFIGMIASVILVMAGYVCVLVKTESRKETHLLNIQDTIASYKIVLTSFPEERTNSWKQVGEIEKINSHHEWKNASGKVLLYFNKDDFPTPYRYGDVLIVKGHPRVVAAPSNPYEFDYKRFLSFQNIYHQQYLKTGETVFVKNSPPTFIVDWAMRARSWAQDKLSEYVTGDREQAIVKALVLGITDDLDNEMLQAYAASGAMHVLAVSGLHVGIIYGIILFLLSPFRKRKHGKWMVALISVACLWFYVFVTGMSPSVLRAATMFTVIAFSTVSNRQANIYNTLAIAAFCLLLYDPYLIMSVGFQLSFLAVAGIVYFYPKFYLMWEPPYQWTNAIWKITCVSLSAQLATCAVGLLYFHQFPVYFLVTNLLVIPFASFILTGGLLILAASYLLAVASFLGTIVTWFVKILNGAVFLTERVPFSLIKDVYITTFQCWLLMALLAMFVLLLELKTIKVLYISVMLALSFAILQWYHYTSDIAGARLVVYNLKHSTAIDLMDHGTSYFFGDSTTWTNKDLVRFHVTPCRLVRGITNVCDGSKESFVKTFSGGRLILWNDYRILQITDKHFEIPSIPEVDCLVIGNNATIELSTLQKHISFNRIVVDSSNSDYVTDKLIGEGVRLSVPVYSVVREGAITIKI